jgi:hypothetical protein
MTGMDSQQGEITFGTLSDFSILEFARLSSHTNRRTQEESPSSITKGMQTSVQGEKRSSLLPRKI